MIVQPSTRRVFTDQEYVQAGAILSDDLSPANCIFGVKEIPVNSVLEGKSYMFFSHTIKAQPENMPLLDKFLEKKSRLLDYECIVDPKTNQRMIAFGKFAGIAGMVDCFRGIGEKLLAMGYSTPFLGISSSYMYPSIKDAEKALKNAGKQISTFSFPSKVKPISFVFTGSGNVNKGALSMFKFLPHEFVDKQRFQQQSSESPIIAFQAKTSDLVRRMDGSEFDREDYYMNPHLYEPIFHEDILPHTNVLVNCMYWDHHFPRLISKQQMKEQFEKDKGLLHIADISCDINGSIEFMQKATQIDNPFFYYDPIAQNCHDDIDAGGVQVLGVDILPSEFPRESSEHFSSKLRKFAESLSELSINEPIANQNVNIAVRNACICENGHLSPAFQYIEKLRSGKKPSHLPVDLPLTKVVHAVAVEGHIFDSGLINQILDVIEDSRSSFKIIHLNVSPNHTNMPLKSRVVLQIEASSQTLLDDAICGIQDLCDTVTEAQAVLKDLPFGALLDASEPKDTLKSQVHVLFPKSEKVVVLGSGMVAGPLVEYLDKAGFQVSIASNDLSQAEALANSCSKRTNALPLKVSQGHEVSTLLQDHNPDLVISLLPAFLHGKVGEACLSSDTHLITASYVSPEMKSLDAAAKEKGLVFLNEMGLDPGIDHMSAMRLIHHMDDSEGAVLNKFESFCGGLPAPECCDNPLGYKFSWSPKGMISAMAQQSKYRRNHETITLEDETFKHARVLDHFPMLHLEHYPNRDSLAYASIYGIPDFKQLDTMYRATLRYQGFSELMTGYSKLGLLSTDVINPGLSWERNLLQRFRSYDALKDRVNSLSEKTRESLKWLGVLSSLEKPSHGFTFLDCFSNLLEKKLKYTKGERDMVVMTHKFEFIRPSNGDRFEASSDLVVYGKGHGQGHSAMAECVGLPVGIAAKLILSETDISKGVIIPNEKSVYAPTLRELEDYGIFMNERISSVF